MAGGYLAALAWILSLALIDGWSRGLATQLTPQAEYLHDVPKVTGIPAMISGFASHILDFRPGSWATHVAGPVTARCSSSPYWTGSGSAAARPGGQRPGGR